MIGYKMRFSLRVVFVYRETERAQRNEEESDIWWEDLLWGFWNGLSAWVVLVVHAFGAWERFPFYNVERQGNWYDFGFLLGAGSPFLGIFGKGGSAKDRGRPRQRSESG